MSEELVFLDFAGLEDHLVRELRRHICPLSENPDVKFPWDCPKEKKKEFFKGNGTYLNVFAPAFKSAVISNTYPQNNVVYDMTHLNTYSNGSCVTNSMPTSAPSDFVGQTAPNLAKYHPSSTIHEINGNYVSNLCNNGESLQNSSDIEGNGNFMPHHVPAFAQNSSSVVLQPADSFPNGKSVSTFKLCPTVSSFVPQSMSSFVNQTVDELPKCESSEFVVRSEMPELSNKVENSACESVESVEQGSQEVCVKSNDISSSDDSNRNTDQTDSVCDKSVKVDLKRDADVSQSVASTPPTPYVRSFADVLRCKNDQRTSNSLPLIKKPIAKLHASVSSSDSGEDSKSCIKEDKMAITLGRHLYELKLDFSITNLQPRGLINRRNWCYINATLQALLACPPFYSLLRNLPLGPAVDRGKSSTPVIDSMVKLSYEFVQLKEDMEDLQPGVPFQPVTVYEMLGIMKSDCLKGQQEDAEEFLSYILNGMHEEMVSVIKNYENLFNLNVEEEMKPNGHGDAGDTDDEWKVIGVKQRCMVTRKVVEQKTPISDLLGGQIKSFLTTNGNKTSASVQPFFTLQLDIQSENVTSVEEALNQMTVKEPIQGYTCAKTKQEVEAYSRIMLQKLPPVLVLHLKRFVYNRNGGCKKVMKHTEYPINLELKKELFTPEAKKTKRPSSYKLFAVMYHDGAEAILGHYISDIYHHSSKTWIRCDDRTISSITEAQVLSHSPPRVPYLLFYQACYPSHGKDD